MVRQSAECKRFLEVVVVFSGNSNAKVCAMSGLAERIDRERKRTNEYATVEGRACIHQYMDNPRTARREKSRASEMLSHALCLVAFAWSRIGESMEWAHWRGGEGGNSEWLAGVRH